MNTQNKKVVIFDFDGVLANTLEIAFQIHKEVNAQFTWGRFQSLSHGNFWTEYEQLVREGHVQPQDYIERYNRGIEVLTIHDILRETIRTLSEKYPLYIVSSSESFAIKNFLKKEGVENTFKQTLGSDVHTSKESKFKLIFEQEHVLGKDVIFVTDTTGDIREAKKCGILTIAVTWGLHTREMLTELHPASVIDDPRELLEAVELVLES